MQNHVKIDKIYIENFRRFHKVTFEIGSCLTLIAGQNGTSKSTLLGMLCQPFSFGVFHGLTARQPDNSKYTDNYHDIKLSDFKDLTGNPYLYDCEDVFRLSKVHDTIDNKYLYRLHLSGNCITSKSPIYKDGLLVRTQLRPDKKRIRFVADPNSSSEAGEGNFPLIGTTHSLFLLKHAFQSKIKNKVKVIYLKRENDNVIDSGYSTFENIENNLKAQAQPIRSERPKKVSLIFEDKVGKNMFFAIIGNTLDQFFRRIEMRSLSAGSLANLASLSLKVPELEKVILIPDGDVKSDLKVYAEKSKNLIFLPGDLYPEALLYNCLKNLSDADSFWCECPARSYSKQVAIIKPGKVPPDPNDAKKWYKNWYEDQSKYWGKGNRKAFLKWAINNKELCREFCREFFKILKRISPDAIPQEKIQSILGKYL